MKIKNYYVGITMLLLAAIFSSLENTSIDMFNGWFKFMAWGTFLFGWFSIIRKYIDNGQ